MNKSLIALSSKLALSIALLSASVSAFSYDFSTLKQGHPVGQLGAYVSSQGKGQDLAMKTLIGDSYSVNSGSQSGGLIGLGYFLDGQTINRVQMAYGINAFYLTSTEVSGKITQEHLFTNLSYSYNIWHLPVYAAAKALIDMRSSYYLTIDAGIGPNFFTTSDYQEHSLDGGVTLPDHVFSGQTNTTFSATAGIGVKFNHVIGQLPLECGYRFFYLGQGSFNKTNSQQIDNMQTGNSYANALLCAVSI